MSMEKEQFEVLCAAFALGTIAPDEQTLLDEGLASGNDEFQKIFRESVGVAYAINSSIKRISPPPQVRTRMLQRIQYGDSVPSALFMWFERFAATLGFGRPGFGLLVAVLLLIVIAEIGAYAYMVSVDLDAIEQPAAAAEARLQELEKNIAAVKSELHTKNEILTVLQSHNINLTLLNGQDASPSSAGKILWDPERSSAVLHAYNLPIVDDASVYQLWVTGSDARTISAGTFSVPDRTEHFFRTFSLPLSEANQTINSFSITIETKGGAAQPSGPAILRGSYNAVRNK